MLESGCVNCPANAACDAPYRGSRCRATRSNFGLDYDPKTHGDDIRAMDDEKLAAKLCTLFCRICDRCPIADYCNQAQDGVCVDTWLSWLRMPVAKGETDED